MSQTLYNPIVSVDDTQFVSQLYGSGVGLPGAANTNTLTQNEQRIRGMITTDNLDYVSKAGFLKYQAIKSNTNVTLAGEFNTLYTIENPTSPATGIDINITFAGGNFPLSAQLPAGEVANFLVDGVGTPSVLPSVFTPTTGINVISARLN